MENAVSFFIPKLRLKRELSGEIVKNNFVASHSGDCERS